MAILGIESLTCGVDDTLDYVAMIEFCRDRLNRRITDHFKSVDAFARADGTNEHYSVFLFTCNLPITQGKRGWLPDRAARGGPSRHRASSALYCYIECPAGGEAEYRKHAASGAQ